MGNRYIVARHDFTPTAGQDILTIRSVANRRCRLISVSVVGRGATSASQVLQIAKAATVGVTPGGAIVLGKAEHTEQPTAATLTATTWATQPVLTADNNEVVGWNALGGVNRWVTPPGKPNGSFEIRNAEELSIRAPSGPTYQAMSISVVVEED